ISPLAKHKIRIYFMPKLSNQEEKKLVKIGEAAKILGVSIDTLRRWEAKGKIETVRTPGGTRLYSVGSLDKVVSKKEAKQGRNRIQTTEKPVYTSPVIFEQQNTAGFSLPEQPEIAESTTFLSSKVETDPKLHTANLLDQKENQVGFEPLESLLAEEPISPFKAAELQPGDPYQWYQSHGYQVPDNVAQVNKSEPDLNQLTLGYPISLEASDHQIYAKIYAILRSSKLNPLYIRYFKTLVLTAFLLSLVSIGLIVSSYLSFPPATNCFFQNQKNAGVLQRSSVAALSPFNSVAQ